MTRIRRWAAFLLSLSLAMPAFGDVATVKRVLDTYKLVKTIHARVKAITKVTDAATTDPNKQMPGADVTMEIDKKAAAIAALQPPGSPSQPTVALSDAASPDPAIGNAAIKKLDEHAAAREKYLHDLENERSQYKVALDQVIETEEQSTKVRDGLEGVMNDPVSLAFFQDQIGLTWLEFDQISLKLTGLRTDYEALLKRYDSVISTTKTENANYNTNLKLLKEGRAGLDQQWKRRTAEDEQRRQAEQAARAVESARRVQEQLEQQRRTQEAIETARRAREQAEAVRRAQEQAEAARRAQEAARQAQEQAERARRAAEEAEKARKAAEAAKAPVIPRIP